MFFVVPAVKASRWFVSFSLILCLSLFCSSTILAGDTRGLQLNSKGATPVENTAQKGIAYNPAKNHALVIGINDYDSWPDLNSARKDAEAISRLLVSEFSFPKENVITLLDGEATKRNVQLKLRELRDLKEDDSLLIYYAGHGWQDEGTGEGYWITKEISKDASWEGLSTSNLLNAYLKPLRVKHLAVIVDACFGGALLASRGIDRSPFHAKKYSRISRTALTSGNLEPVPDDGGSGYSVFNLKLQQYMKGELGNSNKEYFTLTEMYAAIAPEVSRYSASSQEPVLARLNDPKDAKGEYVFYRKPNGIVSLPLDLGGGGYDEMLGGSSMPRGYGSLNSLNSFSSKFLFKFHGKNRFGSPIGKIAYVPGTNNIAVSSGSKLTVYDVKEDAVIDSVDVEGTISALDSIGTKIAIGTTFGKVYIYDLSDRAITDIMSGKKGVRHLAFSTSGMVATAFDSGLIEVFELGSGRTVTTLREKESKHTGFFMAKKKTGVAALEYSPDGSTVVSIAENNSIEFWDVASGRKVRSMKEDSDNIMGAAVSDDGTLVAVAEKVIVLNVMERTRTDNRYLVVRRTDTGNEMKKIKIDENVSFIRFYSNKRYLLVASEDKVLRVYDIITGNSVTELNYGEEATAFSSSSDGSFISYSSDNKLFSYAL